jgi:hypothetical protein
MAELTEERIREIVREELLKSLPQIELQSQRPDGSRSGFAMGLIPKPSSMLYHFARDRGLPTEPPME